MLRQEGHSPYPLVASLAKSPRFLDAVLYLVTLNMALKAGQGAKMLGLVGPMLSKGTRIPCTR